MKELLGAWEHRRDMVECSLILMKDYGIEVAIEVDELEGGGVQVDQKCACMYAYGRYPLEATTFAHRRNILSFLSISIFPWMLKQRSISLFIYS